MPPLARKFTRKQQHSQLNLLVRGLLERWVLEHKTLLVIENAQWIDGESARLALEIISEFSTNIYVLFTSRPVLDWPPHLAEIFALVETRRFLMRLGTMQQEDLQQLVCNQMDLESVPKAFSR